MRDINLSTAMAMAAAVTTGKTQHSRTGLDRKGQQGHQLETISLVLTNVSLLRTYYLH